MCNCIVEPVDFSRLNKLKKKIVKQNMTDQLINLARNNGANVSTIKIFTFPNCMMLEYFDTYVQ